MKRAPCSRPPHAGGTNLYDETTCFRLILFIPYCLIGEYSVLLPTGIIKNRTGHPVKGDYHVLDLLVHVDLPDESRFVMALGNINNYLAALNGNPAPSSCSPTAGRPLPRPERQRANRSHRETGSGRGFLPRMRQRHEEGPHHQGRPAPLRRSRARRRRGNRPPPTRRLRLHQAVITKTAGASLS